MKESILYFVSPIYSPLAPYALFSEVLLEYLPLPMASLFVSFWRPLWNRFSLSGSPGSPYELIAMSFLSDDKYLEITERTDLGGSTGYKCFASPKLLPTLLL